MQLLLSRAQSGASVFSLVPLKIGSGVTFSLQAAIELDEEEQALIKQYNFAKVPIIVSDPIDDIRQAFRPAMLLGFIAFVVFWFLSYFSFALGIAILTTLVMTAVYFKALREQLIVSDLMAGGKKFRCDSVVELIQKEAYLEGVCGYLRQLLESAKHWGDREVIDIQPLDKEAAKQAVLKAL